jgi:predicted alpha/beta-hydrolase family hydrolase
MLAAAEPKLADGLLLLSYPLHPPRRPAELRTAHFPNLRTPALFVHGSRDPFGTLAELRSALSLIPAVTGILEIEGAGHDLSLKSANVASRVAAEFLKFVSAL